APPAGGGGPGAATAAAADTTSDPGFASYQSLLDQYLRVTSPGGAPIQTQFDYWELYHSPARAERLARVKFSLLQATPLRMSAPDRLAWGINTYNFMVLQLLTDNL